MRNLASVQTIKKIEPIEGADAIERATVLGWHLVVKKNEFTEGSRCVYVEIDSILPERPEFEFLRPRKFRIKTVRLRGQISQGICFPMSILPKGKEYTESEDVTELLGIQKWEPVIPVNLAGKVIGPFPAFMVKTDETRVQVLEGVLKRYAGIECFATEKIDGSSATYFYKDGQFGVCSRNLQLADTEDNTFWQIAKKYEIEKKLKTHGKNIAIQGEVYGSGIQTNALKLRDKRIAFFNVFDIDKYTYLDRMDFLKFFKELDLPSVPTVCERFTLPDNSDELIKLSVRKSLISPDLMAEGIVIRPFREMMDLEMSRTFGSGRLSFKAVNPEYLLKNE